MAKAKKPKRVWPQYGWGPVYANGKVGTVYSTKKYAVYYSGFAAGGIIKVEIRPARRVKK